jgi:hypothetical protein
MTFILIFGEGRDNVLFWFFLFICTFSDVKNLKSEGRDSLFILSKEKLKSFF